MRKWFLLLIAIIGIVIEFIAVPDGAEACGRRRFRTAGYCPPACYVQLGPQLIQPRPVTIKGKVYYILPTGEEGENDQEELQGKRSVFSRSSGIPEWDVFDGKVRKIAKVTILEGQAKPFSSVSELRNWLGDSHRDDKDMDELGIGRGPDVDRVKEEKQNVTVRAYIYTFRKESDNDYHVIIGDAPGTPNRKFLNAEVSGIPDIGTDQNRNQLWTVRRAFKQTFELDNEGPDRYAPLNEPVPVKITGSLFWDVEHYPRTVGPKFASPKSAWEIHPISSIEFLD